ncbi:MAG TPA: thiol peroxidase [Anaerolineales bacterium]|nr:thiol peroxidase [Anaerolineales bacterium]
MSIERTDVLQLGGKFVTVVGEDVVVGQQAPEFTVHKNDWSALKGIADTAGKVRVIASVPSLDTNVCATETRRFNADATALSEDVVVIVISTDLPFAQKRWCGAEGIERVITASDHYDVNFGEGYGVLVKERRYLRRAVWVVDRNNQVVYSEYMPALGNEPDYAAVLAAAKAAL